MLEVQLEGDGPWPLIFDSDHPPYSATQVATNGNRDVVTRMLEARTDREVGREGETKILQGVPVCRLATPAEVESYRAKQRSKPKRRKLVPVRFLEDSAPFSAGSDGWVTPQRAQVLCKKRRNPAGGWSPIAEPLDPETMLTAAETVALEQEGKKSAETDKPRAKPAPRRKPKRRRQKVSFDEKGAPEKK